MNRTKIRIFAVLLLAACFWLSGCEGQTTAETDTETAAPAEVTAKYSGYSIVRPDSGSEGEIQAAIYLRNAFEEAGEAMTLTTDWVNRGEEMPADTPEILVGDTNRPETALYASSLRKGEFAAVREGNRIVLAGGSDDGTQKACEWFAANALHYTGDGLYSGGDQYVEKVDYRVEDAQICGSAITEYTILYTGNRSQRTGYRCTAAGGNSCADRLAADGEKSQRYGSGKGGETDSSAGGRFHGGRLPDNGGKRKCHGMRQ